VVIAVGFLWPITSSATGTTHSPTRAVVARETPLRVMLIGDSLASASKDSFAEALTADGNAIVDSSMVRGGSAICDWLPSLASTLQAVGPDVAVVELSGNSITPCMSDPATGKHYVGEAWLAKYRTDTAAAMDVFNRFDVTVYWIGAPRTREDTGGQAALNAIYEQAAERLPSAQYVNAGDAVLDHGKYTDYLPCSAGEPCTGTDPSTGQPANRVRAPDGGHFCPNGAPAFSGVTGPCTVWSSGAWRFGKAMAAPLVEAYGL
jgi:hypothetical protein